ncbi:MAG: hypothetical protein J2P27_08320 [Actinobacteria bacterium]|nr:hypothetical protein [Actinomycetota bacterium]
MAWLPSPRRCRHYHHVCRRRYRRQCGHGADVLYGVLSPELYSLYVRDRGWTTKQWEQWTYHTLRSQLSAD